MKVLDTILRSKIPDFVGIISRKTQAQRGFNRPTPPGDRLTGSLEFLKKR
jgi:hypothetical protein